MDGIATSPRPGGVLSEKQAGRLSFRFGLLDRLARRKSRDEPADRGGRLLGLPARQLSSRAKARAALGVPTNAALVVGWAGPLDLRSGILDLIEAAAICDDGVVIVVPGGPAHEQVLDQADARDLLHRVRFAAGEMTGGQAGSTTGLAAFPTLLAAVDVLMVAPPRRRSERRQFAVTLAWARSNAIPCIGMGRPASTGGTTWTVRRGDSGLLARLLTGIAMQPALLQAATQDTSRQPPDQVGEAAQRCTASRAKQRFGDWRTMFRRSVFRRPAFRRTLNIP